jgi:hypothetical protein
LDDEAYGGQVLVVLGEDDEEPAPGHAFLDHLLRLAPKVFDGEVVLEPDDHDEGSLYDGIGDRGKGYKVYIVPP